MMYRITRNVCLVTLAACTLGLAASDAPTSATGDGTMSFGEDGHGRAWLRFTAKQGAPGSNSLLFAAEHHHHRFPDVIIRLSSFEQLTFGADNVSFSGDGTYHEDIVSVKVKAYDHTSQEKPDRFTITCTDAEGNTVFNADGTLFRGDIAIGGGS